MAYLRLVDMPFPADLLFTVTTWLWLAACLLTGAAYSFVLYRFEKKTPGNPAILFILRTLSVAAIAFLLFAPLLKITSEHLEKPLIIIAEDNSASVDAAKASNFNLNSYKGTLKKLISNLQRNYQVQTFSFGNQIKSNADFTFKEPATNIAAVFQKINEEYSGRNIGALILASDGIYNLGGNPEYEAGKLKSPVYTIALGDTVPKPDLLISNVRYNNIVYLNNQFQIEVQVDGYFFKRSTTTLTVADGSGIVASKPVNISSSDFHMDIPIILDARKKGIQQYKVQLTPVKGELSEKNNSKTIFVEVIDGRTKVLLIANSPHPDITAIKQSIETNSNYEVKVSVSDSVTPGDIKKADLLIFHQLPSASNPASNLIQLSAGKPLWFIYGAQTDAALFSSSQNVLNVADAGPVTETFAALNPGFYSFSLSDSIRHQLQTFPPLLSPSGNYTVRQPASVLFTQQQGNTSVRKPLLLFSDRGSRKTAVLAGEGIWRWRLENFRNTGNHTAIDELLTKTVQYLSSKEDKRKFRVYPAKNSFDENEPVLFTAELYNDSYQLINDPEVKIVLRNSRGKSYPFIFSRTENSYSLDAGLLPPGEYNFNAGTSLGENKYSATGRFIIARQETELLNTVANHRLLFNLAKNSGGRMLFPGQIQKLPRLLKENELIRTVSHEERKYEDLIDLKILFFLILAFLGLEWFIRKRNGKV